MKFFSVAVWVDHGLEVVGVAWHPQHYDVKSVYQKVGVELLSNTAPFPKLGSSVPFSCRDGRGICRRRCHRKLGLQVQADGEEKTPNKVTLRNSPLTNLKEHVLNV